MAASPEKTPKDYEPGFSPQSSIHPGYSPRSSRLPKSLPKRAQPTSTPRKDWLLNLAVCVSILAALGMIARTTTAKRLLRQAVGVVESILSK